MHALLLANGQFPRRPELRQALRNAPLLICCDGDYNRLVHSRIFRESASPQVRKSDDSHSIPPIHVVGDLDSLSPSLIQRQPLHARFVQVTEQETNDLCKAIRYALSLQVTSIDILGATGLREDHTIGNIAHLPEFAQMPTANGRPLQVRMLTDYGFFTPVVGSATLTSFPGQQVSVFSLTPQVPVTYKGLQYPLKSKPLLSWWQGTLNCALGNSFTVTSASGLLIVYQTWKT